MVVREQKCRGTATTWGRFFFCHTPPYRKPCFVNILTGAICLAPSGCMTACTVPMCPGNSICLLMAAILSSPYACRRLFRQLGNAFLFIFQPVILFVTKAQIGRNGFLADETILPCWNLNSRCNLPSHMQYLYSSPNTWVWHCLRKASGG